MIAEKIKQIIAGALKNLKLPVGEVSLEHPDEFVNGDYSTNVALVFGKQNKINPKELAEKLILQLRSDLENSKRSDLGIEKIQVAGPGFINFYLTKEFFTESLKEILKKEDKFGRNDHAKSIKAIVEYTDPNPFKEFHIGHLMSNTIGEAISRIVEASGAKLKRACYQGDVGAHVAKAVWALLRSNLKGAPEVRPLTVSGLGEAYAEGAQAYESDETAKKEINDINKKIYERTDKNINKIYDRGRKISLDYFDTIYKKLGTKFDYFFFEGESGEFGKKIVLEFLKKGIFEKSDGAIVFKGEKFDPKLHTRVFLNKDGLPTYEAKELGLAKMKYKEYSYDLSVVITGNEVNDYFKVLLKAMEQIFPELAKKTAHISHGMLRLPTGKMSSRTGDVITAEWLLDEIGKMVVEKIKETGRAGDNPELVNQISVAALKYFILRQSPGRDIIFDFEKSISFEGDSGPYLQYSYARARSILEKAKQTSPPNPLSLLRRGGEVYELERLLYRFPEIVLRAGAEYAPHYIATYLIDLSRSFNTFYGETKIVDKEDLSSPYKVALTEAFSIVLKNGLNLLGIQAPEKM